MAKAQPKQPNTSIRLWTELVQELEWRVASGASRSELINAFAVEGMRIDAHPGIVFRDGPAGRRPGLADGPDVWEIARVLSEVEPRGEAAVDATAERLGLTTRQVLAALGYYAAYKAEIDEWISEVDRQAEWMERAWRQRSGVLA